MKSLSFVMGVVACILLGLLIGRAVIPPAPAVLVPQGPASVRMAIYVPTGTHQLAGYAPVKIARIRDQYKLRSLVTQLNSVERVRANTAAACQLDNGSQVVLSFSYRDGAKWIVHVHTSGCGWIRAPGLGTGAPPPGLLAEIEGLAATTKLRQNPPMAPTLVR